MIIIAESWLNSNTLVAAVEISKKIHAHRRDLSTPGDGVLVYVQHQIPTTRLKNLVEDDKEVLWLTLRPPRAPRPYSLRIVISVYYPPGQTSEDGKEIHEYIANGLGNFKIKHNQHAFTDGRSTVSALACITKLVQQNR